MVHGLCFYRASVKVERLPSGSPLLIHNRLNQDRSDFDTIFSCIYPLLQGHVLFDEEGFGSIFPEGKNVTSHTVELLELPDTRFSYERTRKVRLMSSDVVSSVGKYVQDDWGTTILYRHGNADPLELLKVEDAVSQSHQEMFVQSDEAQVILHNWDGVYWEIYTKNPDMTRQLLETHRDNERLSIYKVAFHLDFPDPRKATLEKA